MDIWILNIGQLCKWMESSFSAILPVKAQIISCCKTYLLKLITKNCPICHLQVAVSYQQNTTLISCLWIELFRSYCTWKWMWKSTPSLKLLWTCCGAREIVLGHVMPWLSEAAALQSQWWGWEKRKKIRAHIDMEKKIKQINFFICFFWL